MSQPEDDAVPPTEPQVPAVPSEPKAKRSYKRKGADASADANGSAGPRAPSAGRIAGASLVPDLTKRSEGFAKQAWYWVGVLPGCPTEWVNLCGINFPKTNAVLIESRGRKGRKEHLAVIGSLVQLDRHKIQMMRDRLPRTVIRFYTAGAPPLAPGAQDSHASQNLADLSKQGRSGQLITIPTEEQIAECAKNGRPTQRYSPGPNDEPAARYMFAHLCEDQIRGNRRDTYPEPLETAGLEWPDELDDVAATA